MHHKDVETGRSQLARRSPVALTGAIGPMDKNHGRSSARRIAKALDHHGLAVDLNRIGLRLR
jgi:hypothetical protein